MVERLVANEKVAGSTPVCRSQKIMKKVYIASRFAKKEEARSLLKKLDAQKYESVTIWLDFPNLRPLEENLTKTKECAEKCLVAINTCDIFILLSDEAGTGMYIELGAALSQSVQFSKPKVFVVGPHGTNSIFSYHPNITWLQNLDELFKRL